jgi:hypothetical protein
VLFKETFKALIREGSVTMTFRAWRTAKVVVGNSYRLGPDDAIVVKAVDEVTVGSITAAQARRSGFAHVDELFLILRKSVKSRLTSRSKVFRVAFRHEQQVDPRAERRTDVSVSALEEVLARLERMDRLSRRGPWTNDALQLIAEHPKVAASKLAPRMQRETRALKADIRKLKELGLTVSHEVGYSLSPRGRALLRRVRR